MQAGLPIPNLSDVTDSLMDTFELQKSYIEDLAKDIAEQLDTAGLGCVNKYAVDKLENAKEAYTDMQVSCCTRT